MFVLLLGWRTPLIGQDRAAGTVTVLTGRATAERGGQNRALERGDANHESETVRTGASSQLGLTRRDETRLSFGPATETTLATFEADANASPGLRRARLTTNQLVAAGVPTAKIDATSHGEADLLVARPDGVAAARNRRVERTVR